jgi:hypothetical protein
LALNNDKEVIEGSKGRQNTLKGKIQEASLRDQIPKKLLSKLNDLDIGQQVAEIWNSANANRSEWLDSQMKLLQEFEQFVAPIYQPAYNWSSTVHLPVAYTLCRTFHSRMYSALFSFDPFFTVTARKEANSDRAPLVQELLRYTLKEWCNDYSGIEEVCDRWLWSWITSGRGILKSRWERKYTRFMDVVDVQRPGPTQFVIDEQGNEQAVPTMETVEEEQEVVLTCFDGPQVDLVLPEDLVIVGGEGDPDKADVVIHQQFLTASELWTLSDQGIFDEDAVRNVIAGGPSSKSGDVTGIIKQERSELSQQGSLDVEYDQDRYRILECYMKKSVDGSGIASDIVVWVCLNTRDVLRASYLHRLSKAGQRPFAVIDFHRKTDTSHPVGLVELTYSLCKELDTIHNMRLDFGLLSTLPFGFYRASSSLSQTKIPLEPGSLMPTDNPQTDIFFPNLGNRTSWGMQEEAALYNYVERMTSVSDLSLGILGGQGASRTATGSRIVANENNSNLDIYLKRMNRGVKKLLRLIFEQVQMRIPAGLQFKLLGEDGNNYWGQVKSREEIAGNYDFELEGSSAASNKQVQIDTAQQIYQVTANPLDIQLGIITPAERFEAVKNLLQAIGVRSWSKFVRKPDGASRLFTPEEIANRVLAGVDVRLGPEQDLDGFIQYVQYVFDTDELLGQFNEEQTILLARKMQEAQQMSQALKEMASQQANARQMQNNAAMSAQQTQPGAASPMGPASMGA